MKKIILFLTVALIFAVSCGEKKESKKKMKN